MHGRERLDDAKRKQSAGTAARRRRGTTATSVLIGQEGALSPRQTLALQRSAGNAVVVQLLNETKPGGSSSDGLGGAVAEMAADVAPVGDAATQFTGASAGSGFTNPAASSAAANYGGVAGATIGSATSVVALGDQSMKYHQARMDRQKEKPGTAKHHKLSREVRAGRGGMAEQAAGVASQSTSLAGVVLNILGYAAANSVAAGSAGAGVLGSAVQSVRFIRKAEKARQRVNRLQALMADEEKPREALKAAESETAAAQEVLELAEEGARRANEALANHGKQQASKKDGEDPDVLLEHRKLKVKQAQAMLERSRQDIAAAKEREQERAEVSRKIEAALKEQTEKIQRSQSGGPEDISLREIQEYAERKNKRGVTVKAISAVAGLLGVGGSVASMVAGAALAAGAAAGAGVLVATPVGWGLAGAAALVALGVSGWKVWELFRKRWAQTGAPDPTDGHTLPRGERLGKTLAFWKKLAPSERDQYAGAPYEMARDETQAERVEEARNTLVALGLNWDEMKNDAKNGKKLIAAKLASSELGYGPGHLGRVVRLPSPGPRSGGMVIPAAVRRPPACVRDTSVVTGRRLV